MKLYQLPRFLCVLLFAIVFYPLSIFAQIPIERTYTKYLTVDEGDIVELNFEDSDASTYAYTLNWDKGYLEYAYWGGDVTSYYYWDEDEERLSNGLCISKKCKVLVKGSNLGTIKVKHAARRWYYEGNVVYEMSATFYINVRVSSKPKLTLTSNIEEGSVKKGSNFKLTSSESESTIYYSDSWISDLSNLAGKTKVFPYSGITISEPSTIYAIAVKKGYPISDVCKWTFDTYDSSSIINETNFPDVNFRNYLLNQDYGQDGVLTENEIKKVTSIDVNNMEIKSLKGIEQFTSLTTLICGENQLTSLDVSKNTKLSSLYCYTNQLISLDVSKNTALTSLYCYTNQLISLDVSKNTALTSLDCSGNQLISFDVSKNTALLSLSCSNNQLTSLDVSKNLALKYLSCIKNKLNLLDISKNTALNSLACTYNHLTSLDVSKNLVLQSLKCGSTQLTTLDISKNTALTYLACHNNQLASLDVSKNTALNTLYCYRNKIRGKNMDDLISSLPQNGTANVYAFYVINNSEDDEQNNCTRNQVSVIRSKGWTPLCYNGTEWLEFEGSDNEEPAGLKGDVNGDGEVSGTDLVALTNMILGKSEKKATADLNGDGEVNGTDYVMLVNIVLGK